eukprot:SAG31_NODE_948_length_10825_cov_9.412829_14_plen_88_part_00
MWPVDSAAQAQRSPNGAGKRVSTFIDIVLGTGLVDYAAATEKAYRRVSYLSQLAQSEAMRTVVDGKGCYFLVFVPTIREIRYFYREM